VELLSVSTNTWLHWRGGQTVVSVSDENRFTASGDERSM
jgi:hypothetical protein